MPIGVLLLATGARDGTKSAPKSNGGIPGDRRSQISRISFTEIQSNYQPGHIVSIDWTKLKQHKMFIYNGHLILYVQLNWAQ